MAKRRYKKSRRVKVRGGSGRPPLQRMTRAEAERRIPTARQVRATDHRIFENLINRMGREELQRELLRLNEQQGQNENRTPAQYRMDL